MKKLIFSVFCILTSSSALTAKQPNIIYIMTDQHSANALSCAGNEDVKTPNIDRLAAHGVRFTNAYCAQPISGPSRASMMTGYMPSAIGMQENETPLPDSLRTRTMGNQMEAAGYHNGYAGKWHVNTNSLPGKHAFGFENLHGHDDNGLAEAAVDFIGADHGGKPFLLVASFDNPHNICEYARGQQLPFATIKDGDPKLWPNLPRNFYIGPYEADILRWEREQSYRLYPTKGYKPDDWRRYRNAYYRLVEHIDAEIGKIVDEIDRRNLWDNTVVIFTSDHGDGQGAHQWNQKTVLFEEVNNIPLIVCVPGGKNAGKTSEALVNNGIDLIPSLLDWAGGKPLNDPRLKGKSFRKAAENPESAGANDYVVTETVFAQTGGTKGWSVRTPKYKYVVYEAGENREMLFDMTDDRLEMTNLAIEGRYADVVKEHRAILDRWMTENLPQNKRRPDNRYVPVR